MPTNNDLLGSFGAIFSPCGRYRYALHRLWDDSKPLLMFLMLNPSTANETENDPTVERCQRRAIDMGYGGLLVGNAFALRSTDPAALYDAEDPVGPGNDEAIMFAARMAVESKGMVICGWGTHASYRGRGAQVLRMLLDAGIQPHALRVNKDGSPGHPLYIGYGVGPKPMQVAA